MGAADPESPGWACRIWVGQGDKARPFSVGLELSGEEVERQKIEPIPLKVLGRTWLFRGRLVRVEDEDTRPSDDLLLLIKHAVLREERQLARIRREVEAFENLEATSASRRERIAESVRLFVWQRDEGRCVKCGSQERLEFDHIIPVVHGGSNTERNIQLLWEVCNRGKSSSI